jgi:hypothetical protein
VCAEERKELSLPAAAGGLKTMGYGRMAKHRPGGVLPGGHSPSEPINVSKVELHTLSGVSHILNISDSNQVIVPNVVPKTEFVISFVQASKTR